MDAQEPAKRRFLTHERVALFVGAVVAAISLAWLGGQASIVWHRRAMREQIVASGGEFNSSLVISPWPEDAELRAADPNYSVSMIRSLMGDERMPWILFDRQLTPADREAIEAFPESEVKAVPGFRNHSTD